MATGFPDFTRSVRQGISSINVLLEDPVQGYIIATTGTQNTRAPADDGPPSDETGTYNILFSPSADFNFVSAGGTTLFVADATSSGTDFIAPIWRLENFRFPLVGLRPADNFAGIFSAAFERKNLLWRDDVTLTRHNPFFAIRNDTEFATSSTGDVTFLTLDLGAAYDVYGAAILDIRREVAGGDAIFGMDHSTDNATWTAIVNNLQVNSTSFVTYPLYFRIKSMRYLRFRHRQASTGGTTTSRIPKALLFAKVG